MTTGSPARATYEERIARFVGLRDRAAARSRVLATARLAAFLLAIAAGVLREATGRDWAGAVALLFVVLFAALIVLHGRVRRAERWFDTLRALSQRGLHRLARSWDTLPRREPPPVAADHIYADDADIFGAPALAQLLGPADSPAGRTTLARWLLEPGPASVVRRRQAAVAELAGRIDLRDRLAAHGRAAAAVRPGDLDGFLAWAEDGARPLVTPLLRLAAWAVPAATVGLALADVLGWVERAWWLLPLGIAVALTFGPGRRIARVLRSAFRREGMFEAYPEMLAEIATADFEADELKRLRAALAADGVAADRLLRRLRRLMHLADVRHSGSLYLPLQLLTLWDFHVMAAVDAWRLRAGGRVREWLEAVGEVEALAALATLAHDEPDWCFPEVGDDARIEARALAHPMLPAGRVANDVTVGPPGTFLLVTGSNMSGKSTLLRALATNVALGLAGGPVCARSMRMPVVSLQTSIRVTDSVVQGVSYFMAQLQRMKRIVRAAEAAAPTGPRVLYLLDEILQGTNTAERRIAATRVIGHLVESGALGAVTTHDLELADEPALRGALVPVHFTETITGEGAETAMRFDYALRPGVATSTNALALMRLVGLDAPADPPS